MSIGSLRAQQERNISEVSENQLVPIPDVIHFPVSPVYNLTKQIAHHVSAGSQILLLFCFAIPSLCMELFTYSTASSLKTRSEQSPYKGITREKNNQDSW